MTEKQIHSIFQLTNSVAQSTILFTDTCQIAVRIKNMYSQHLTIMVQSIAESESSKKPILKSKTQVYSISQIQVMFSSNMNFHCLVAVSNKTSSQQSE
jgi:hypothetical protein